MAKKPGISTGFSVLTTAVICSLIAATGLWEKRGAASVDPSPAGSFACRVDQLFEKWDRADSPGCSLAISQNGCLVYQRGYGMANLELGVSITSASVFHVASVAKQFTAMCILLLAQRRQLSLDDEVRKHVPGWANHRSRLTIRHLLTHTGGLRDVFLLRELAAPRGDGTDESDALVRLLARQRGLNFTPGTQYEYNNGGYLVLADIVKRVSGQSLRAFAEANLFKPLGMTHTHFHDDSKMIVPNRASGYSRDAGGLHLAGNGDTNGLVGNAGLFSTAPDLLLWEQNLADVRVGDPALVAAMQKPTLLTGGDTSPYGFGLEIGRYRGLRTVGHGGGDRGYGAYAVRYPDQGLAVAVVCNLEWPEIDPARLAQGVADIYLADVVAAPPPSVAAATPPPVSLSAEQLARKTGLYRDPLNEALLRVSVRDGKLRASTGAGDDAGFELTPVNANRFVISGTPIAFEFVPATAGGAQKLHLIGEKEKPSEYQQLKTFALSRKDRRAFTGDYRSAELDVTYTLAPHGSGLVIRTSGRADVVLQPIYPDAFAGSLVGVVKFSRDARGSVTGFTVNATGARGLRFDRVKR